MNASGWNVFPRYSGAEGVAALKRLSAAGGLLRPGFFSKAEEVRSQTIIRKEATDRENRAFLR